MSKDGFVQVPPDSTGKQVDCSSLSVNGSTVVRQRVVIGDPTSSAGLATVTGGGLNVNISATPSVVLAAGSANIGTLNGISATVNVNLTGATAKIAISATPSVVLAAGTANIGTLNNVSATVVAQVTSLPANIGTINNISAGVVLAAGAANIGTVNGISATVVVAGVVSFSTPPTINNISQTVTTVIGGFLDSSGQQRNLVDSANLALRVNVVAGSGAGANPVSIAAGTANIGFIDHISATVNVAGSLTIGGTPGATSYTAGSSFTMIGGMDGSLARGLLMDAAGHAIISGTVALAAGAANIGTINNISATVNVQGSFTIGGTPGATSYTAGSSFTMIGGMDGSVARGLLMDAAGHAIVSGTVALAAGAANIGTINNISAAVVLGAGAANIGSLNNISATVVAQVTSLPANIGTVNNISATIGITGTVALAAGTANIGTINNISAGVVLAAGAANIGTINNISAAVVLGAGAANIGSINNISAAVVLAAGTNNIGSINNISAVVSVNIAAQSAGNILAVQGPVVFNASITAANAPLLMGGRVKTSASTTATAHAAVFMWMDKAGRQIVQLNHPSLHPSATHGPKSVTLSASANTVLVASAGTACVFVDSILVTSNLAAVTRVDIYETASSAAPEVSSYLAIGGGGFQTTFNPPWQLSAGQALSARLKPSASAQVLVMVHFHVGPA